MFPGRRSPVWASAVVIILTTIAGTTCADSQPNGNRDLQRHAPRQTVWKSLNRRMKSYFEEQKKTLEIIQGKRPPEY